MKEVKLSLIQLRSFETRWRSERLVDDDLQRLESEIIDDPNVGKVMSGTGGLRKMRFAPPSRGRGKSGSFRVCYGYFPDHDRVYLVILFPKNEQANLTRTERNSMKALMQRIADGLKRGENP